MTHRLTRLAALTLGATLTAGLTGVAVGPADAAGSTGSTTTTGTVVAKGGLTARSAPYVAAGKTDAFANGTRLTLTCAVHGPAVDGNDRWYAVKGSASRWVAARYVTTKRVPRACGDGTTDTGTVETTALNKRSGPSVRTAKEGSFAQGDTVVVSCWWPGASDTVWYQLKSGSWVDAQYVSALDQRPALCA